MATATILTCPNCDSVLETSTKKCKFCKQPVVPDGVSLAKMGDDQIKKYIKSYNNMLSDGKTDQGELAGYLAMCFLRLHQYDKALQFFDKALDNNFNDAETYFMMAVTLLRGKKPFLAQRADINKMIDCLNTATEIEDKAIYHLLLGYIKQDYFDRKYLNISPSSKDEYDRAAELGLTEEEEAALTTLLGQ